MDETLKTILMTIALPGLLGLGGYMAQTVLSRITKLERELPQKVTEDDVRQIVSDKIDPIREDIHELKIKIDRIFELLIRK